MVNPHPVHEATSNASMFDRSDARVFGALPRLRGAGDGDSEGHEVVEENM